MVTSEFDDLFKKKFIKIKDRASKIMVIKLLKKILESPDLGKPMRFSRKGTREVYAGSYRLSYIFLEEENKVLFFDLYHKDEQ
jgi:mRNA-degrading endonuclease RelE of RelBE toxin-antitoxin system